MTVHLSRRPIFGRSRERASDEGAARGHIHNDAQPPAAADSSEQRGRGSRPSIMNAQPPAAADSVGATEVKTLIAADGRPEVVYVAAECLHLWNLNVKEETFCIELLVHTRWMADPKDADKIMEESGGDLNEHWEPEWMPRIKIHNTTSELTDREYEYEAHRDEGNVWITGKTWLSVSISEDYQLQSFPFDQQSLECEIELPNAVHVEAMPASAKPGRAWGAQLQAPVLVHPEGVEHLPGKKHPNLNV